MKSIKQFDPFEILAIEPSASNREIKKAYRLMSLKYHPDKNANDPTSAAKFILVSKAYHALTDETAKKNYEKYGNPDGPGAMKVGVGLPRFLVAEKYQLLVLSTFFLFLLVIFPMILICYYQRQKKYAPNGVQFETLQFLTHYVTESTRLKNCPELMAASAESRQMQINPDDDKDMKVLVDEVVELKKRVFTLPIVVRNYYLILGHMQRLHSHMSPRLRKVLDDILRSSILITECMLEIAVLSDWTHAAISILEFRRSLIQALDNRSSTLLEIPHFNEDTIRHCHRGKHAVRELSDFLKQDPEERKGLLEMTAEQQLDIRAFCDFVSQVKIEAVVDVEDEPFVVAGDIATCHVKMTRTNLEEGEATGVIHAPYLPEPKFEEWWVFIIDKTENIPAGGRIVSFLKIKSPERIVEEDTQFRVMRPGKHTYTVLAMSDSYAGCDRSIDIEFKVYTPEEKPREVWIHPEDAKLDEEPTLFQQMLGDIYVHSSDEEEIFDMENIPRQIGKKKPATATDAVSSQKKDESSDDDISDGEK